MHYFTDVKCDEIDSFEDADHESFKDFPFVVRIKSFPALKTICAGILILRYNTF